MELSSASDDFIASTIAVFTALFPLMVAVVGVLIGALLTAINARKAWLREKRLEAVLGLLTAAEQFVASIHDAKNIRLQKLFELRSALDRVVLLGPKPLEEAAGVFLDFVSGDSAEAENKVDSSLENAKSEGFPSDFYVQMKKVRQVAKHHLHRRWWL